MKNLMIFIAGGVVSLILFGAVGLAFAQTQTPPNGDSVFGSTMGRFAGRMMGGRWGNANSQFEGPLHDYKVEAFADALGIDAKEVETSLSEGKTMQEIASENGISDEEFQNFFINVHKAALTKAVADGVITQEQADWMLNQVNQGQAYGFGGMPCDGGYGRGRWSQSSGQGWNDQPASQQP
jgi:hypothetical protein